MVWQKYTKKLTLHQTTRKQSSVKEKTLPITQFFQVLIYLMVQKFTEQPVGQCLAGVFAWYI